MMRIRIDGGQMTTEQLRAIAWASERFGRDVADVTDRQNVQLHWIRIEDVPAIFERLDAVGLTTQEACGDTPRVFLGCPLAGVTADEVLDATPQIREVAARYLGDPAFSNLPRKYKTSISGCRVHCTNPEINDVSFVGVEHPALGAGYDLQVGGGLSTNPMFAQRLGAFVEPDRVRRRLGRRDGALPGVRIPAFAESRAVQVPGEGLGGGEGPRGAREGVPRRLDRLPTDPLRRRDRSPSAITSVCTNSATAGCSSGWRRGPAASPGTSCVWWPTSRMRSAAVRWRATAQQKLVIRDVDPARADELVARLDELDLRARPNPFRKGTMACTGIEFCKLAIGETKGRAVWLSEELAARLPKFDEEIRIHVNGCPNSCARFQVADIGLMSALQPRLDGTRSDAFLVHLGGGMGEGAALGRKVKGVKVFAEDSADYLETLLKRYQQQRGSHTSFGGFVNAMDDEQLARFAAPDGGSR